MTIYGRHRPQDSGVGDASVFQQGNHVVTVVVEYAHGEEV
jgi:hypothetical protein